MSVDSGNPSSQLPIKTGRLIVITGQSGAGKTTLVDTLLALHPHFVRPITCTTRSARDGEVTGVHYHFLTPNEFAQLVSEDYFLETAAVYGQNYGSPKTPVLQALAEGRDVLLVVDVQGAQQIMNCSETLIREALILFFVGAAEHVLRHRIIKRAAEKGKQVDCNDLQRRLAESEAEWQFARRCEYVVVNNRDGDAALASTYQQFREAVLHLLPNPETHRGQSGD